MALFKTKKIAAAPAVAEQPAIKRMRDWMRTCPLIESEYRFGINFLEDQPVAYTIEDVPGIPILTKYFGGAKKQKSYVIATREAYGADVLTNAANSGFFDDIEAWIAAQNDIKNFPEMEEWQQAMSVSVSSSGYIFENDADTARYQIQIAIVFYETERT